MKYPVDDPIGSEDAQTSEEKIKTRLESWKRWGDKYSFLKKLKQEPSYHKSLIALKQRNFELAFHHKTITNY